MKRWLAISAIAALFAAAAPVATGQSGGQVHKGTGLKHDAIDSLKGPSMTMAFAVKDKSMLEKVAKDKKVQFELVQQGQQFVITSVK